MTTTVNDIADLIREVDGDNRMTATILGGAVASWLLTSQAIDRSQTMGVMTFIERTNPDKRLGAGQLAELIVAEFNLTEEHPR